MRLDPYRTSSAACLLGTLAVYLYTLAPTVQGFDSAELTVGAYALGFVHAPGYPLYMLLGHGFGRLPWGNVGLRLNLLSALLGSLATVLLLWTIVPERRAQSPDSPTPALAHAVLAVLMFATAPAVWSQALRAEVYTLHLCLMATVLWLWRKAHRTGRSTPLLLCFSLLGLSLGNHPTTLLLWTALLSGWPRETPHFRRVALVGSGLAAVVALLLYLYFPIRSGSQPAVDYLRTYFQVDLTTAGGMGWLVSAQMFQHAFYLDRDLFLVVEELFRFAALLWENFLGVGALLGLWGWWRLRRKEALWNRLLTVYFVLNAAAFVLYHVVDKEVMFTAAYIVWAIWVAYGLQGAAEWLQRQIPNWRQTWLMSGAVLLVLVLGILVNGPAVSLRTNHRAYDFAARLLEEAKPGAVVVNGWVTASVLDYLRLVEGRHPDVQSFNLDFYNLALQERHGSLTSATAQGEWHAWLQDQLGQRPVCFIEPLPAVPEQYRWVQSGVCWELVPSS